MTLIRPHSRALHFPFVRWVAGILVSMAAAVPGQAQWLPDTRVTTDPAISRTEVDGGRNVVVSDQILMMVWMDARDGNPEIYFRERIAGAWSAPERLTNNSASSTHPAIGRRGDEVRVVWEDARSGHPEIWTKRRIFGTWGADSCVTCDGFDSARPSLDHTGEHLVWEETKDGNREIYYRRRLENGAWEAEFRVSNDDAESSHPTVASPHPRGVPIDPEIRIVAWQDDRHGTWEIYSRFGTFFNGWKPETRVSESPGDSRFPSIAVEDDAFCGDLGFISHWIAWQDDRHGNEEIYFADGSDGFWGPPFRLTNTSTASQHPSIGKTYEVVPGPFGGLVICSGPTLVWEERISGTSGSIRFRDLSTPSDVPISAVSAEPEHASFAFFHGTPSPGIVEGMLAVVWTDERDGNQEIYLAEGTTVLDATDLAELPPAAGGVEIGLARPNPFWSSTSFTVQTSSESNLSVRIVDAAGKLVRTLFGSTSPGGAYSFAWDGLDDVGDRAAAGTYFIVAESEERNAVRRVIHLR